MSAFYRRAEDILQIATAGESTLGDSLMVLDRQGGFRMVNPEGWSMAALAAEYGAEAVYKVERRGGTVRVEGWNGSQRCLLQSESGQGTLQKLLGTAIVGSAVPALSDLWNRHRHSHHAAGGRDVHCAGRPRGSRSHAMVHFGRG